VKRIIFATGIAVFIALSTGCESGESLQAPPHGSRALTVLGNGSVQDRFTSEIWAVGNVAYTTTWGNRGSPGNAVKIWDVSGDIPTLIDSLIVPNAVTLGDIQTSDDGQLLIVATEFSPGSIVLYSLANPRKPQLITRYTTALTDPGVHTANVERVNGRLYAFLSVDIGNSGLARLVIVDITDPATPTQVFTQTMGAPYTHDTFVRDGILFIAVWDAGIRIWDIGGSQRLAARLTTSGGTRTRAPAKSVTYSWGRRARVSWARRRVAISMSWTPATSHRRAKSRSSTLTARVRTISSWTRLALSCTPLITTAVCA
jgi:hypothetical protein